MSALHFEDPALLCFKQVDFVDGRTRLANLVATRLNVPSFDLSNTITQEQKRCLLRFWVQAAVREFGLAEPEHDAPALRLDRVLEGVPKVVGDELASVCFDAVHVEHAARCLAVGAPILFTVDRETALGLYHPTNFGIFPPDLRRLTQTMALSSVSWARSAEDEEFFNAFAAFGRQFYRDGEPCSDVLDFVVLLRDDGRSEGWRRARKGADESLLHLHDGAYRPETCSRPRDLMEAIRRIARNPKAHGFERRDVVEEFSCITSGTKFSARKVLSSQEFYLPQLAISSCPVYVEDAFAFAAACAVSKQHSLILASAASCRRPESLLSASILQDLYTTGVGSAIEVHRLQQATAWASPVYYYPEARRRCSKGQAPSSAIAHAIFNDAKRYIDVKRNCVETSAYIIREEAFELISAFDIDVKELDRAVRLGLPYLEHIASNYNAPQFEAYCAIQAIIARSNTHIRPDSAKSIDVFSCLLNWGFSLSKPGYSREVERRRIARSCAARLVGNRVVENAPGLSDVTGWLRRTLISLGVELDHEDQQVQRQYRSRAMPNYTGSIIDAAAIRLGGGMGLSAISTAWHSRIDDFEDARAAIVAATSGDDPVDLSERLRLPPVSAGPMGVEIRCLVSKDELVQEGRDLRHCVRTYDHAVRSGRSFILRLESPADRSTAELRFSASGFAVAQHQAKERGAPHISHVAALKAYTEALNADHVLRGEIEEAVTAAAHLSHKPTFGAALANPALTRLYLDQIAEILLPPSMNGVTLDELMRHIVEIEVIEHLVGRSARSRPDLRGLSDGRRADRPGEGQRR